MGLITRKSYMDGEVSHEDYYNQFVNPVVRSIVLTFVSKSRIVESQDPRFNDIALSKWDRMAPAIRSACGCRLATANGIGGVTLSDCVCVAKAAARQIKRDSLRQTK